MKSYHLKWSSHLANMGLVFSTLYQSEGLSDVTLYCDDGNIRAHKLLLSTCSDYFLELFLENSSKRPAIVLSGVKVADLRSIMQFIYTGEVSVSEDDLPDLLEVAEMLGVRGLKSGEEKHKEKEEVEVKDEVNEATTETKNESSDFSKEDEIPASISITKVTPAAPEPESNASSPQSAESETSAVQSESFHISVKKDLTSQLTEPEEEQQPDGLSSLLPPAVTSQYSPYFPPAPYSLASPLVSMTNLAAMYQQSSPTKVVKERSVGGGQQRALEWYRQASQEGKVALDLLPDDINSIMAQSTTPYCPICNKDCANFPNLRSHLQVHNSIRPYACTYCEAKFARVSHLNRHIRTHTGERPFACERCGKSFARQDKLKLHMDRHLSRENKTDLMNQLLTPQPNHQSPSKKVKMENNLSVKQELSVSQTTPVSNNFAMMGNNGVNNGSLWGAFPIYNQPSYQPVYPGMVPQYLPQNVSELHNVMKIGECSIKPLGQ